MISSKFIIFVLNFLVMLLTKNDSLVYACINLDLTQVPGQCNKFYRCANGLYLYSMKFVENHIYIVLNFWFNKLLNSCPPGLFFDSNTRVCNYPSQVRCINEDNQYSKYYFSFYI